MEKNILNEVIEAEKDIQSAVECERVRLREWLEQVRTEAGQCVEQETAGLRGSLETAAQDAQRDARLQADTVVRDATERAKSLTGLDDEALSTIVLTKVPRILLE